MKMLWHNILTCALAAACIALAIMLWQSDRRPTAPLPMQSPAPAPIEDLLARKIPTLTFDQPTTLGTAIDTIARGAGCEVRVKWKKVLESSAADPTTTVYLQSPLHNISLRAALSYVLDEARAGIGFASRDGAIEISSPDDVQQTCTVVYNIRDIIDAFVAASAHAHQQDERIALWMRQDVVEHITRVLTDSVDSQSWRENGANTGSIAEIAGLLTVTQTPENQRMVAQVLETFRAASRNRPPLAFFKPPPADASDPTIGLLGKGRDPSKLSLATASTSASPPAAFPFAVTIDGATVAKISLLDAPVPQLSLQDVTLDQAIDLLREQTHVNLILRRQALLDARYKLNQKITLSLENVPLKAVLRSLLQAAHEQAALEPLDCFEDEGMVMITTAGENRRPTTLVLYDVTGLIDALLKAGRRFQADSGLLDGGRQRTLEQVIEHDVAPDSWFTNGGNIGTIDEIFGLLLICQTPDNQIAVRELLEKLHAAALAAPGSD